MCIAAIRSREEIPKFARNHSKEATNVIHGLPLVPLKQVSRVLIEASSHKVHLRKSNTITFDATGSGRPLGAIAATIASYLQVMYLDKL